MIENVVNDKMCLLVHMNEIGISTDEVSVIGTVGLATCMAFILYSKDCKKAIVGHVACDTLINDHNLYNMRLELYELLVENQLIEFPLQLKMMYGADDRVKERKFCLGDLEILDDLNKFYYDLLDILEQNIKKVSNINICSIEKDKISGDDYHIVDEDDNFIYDERRVMSKRFAFDVSSGKFLTNEVFLGDEYIISVLGDKKLIL